MKLYTSQNNNNWKLWAKGKEKQTSLIELDKDIIYVYTLHDKIVKIFDLDSQTYCIIAKNFKYFCWKSYFYLIHCHICSDRICSGLFQITCAILLYHARSRKVIILICLMSSLFIMCSLIQTTLRNSSM